MARNLLIVILVISLVWLFWYQTRHAPEAISANDLTAQPVVTSELNSADTATSQTSHTALKTPKIDGKVTNELPISQDIIKNLLIEVSEARYSDDPVIEMASIMMEITECSVSRNFSRWSYLKPKAAWQQLNQQAEEQCQQLKQQYPTIANERNSEKIMNLLTPTSMQGQQLMDAYTELEHSSENYASIISDIYYLGVSSKNAQLIHMAKLFSLAGSGYAEEVFPYRKILQTEDSTYIRFIDQLALESLACDFNEGVTCQAQKSSMLDRCKQVPDVCGLNFIQWFDTYVSMGIKADVKKLADYYRNLRP